MPDTFKIQTDLDNTEFTPGDTISGTLIWELPKEYESISLRLFWFTRGRGTQDVSIVDELSWQYPSFKGSEKFSFVLPTEPYSFSGKIISLTWALEAVTSPEETSLRKEFTLAPNGKEIALKQIAEPATKTKKSKWFQMNR